MTSVTLVCRPSGLPRWQRQDGSHRDGGAGAGECVRDVVDAGLWPTRKESTGSGSGQPTGGFQDPVRGHASTDGCCNPPSAACVVASFSPGCVIDACVQSRIDRESDAATKLGLEVQQLKKEVSRLEVRTPLRPRLLQLAHPRVGVVLWCLVVSGGVSRTSSQPVRAPVPT